MTCTATPYVTGDDWTIAVDLDQDGSPLNATSASIRFGVVTTANPPVLSAGPITASSSETGAAWAVGRVVCVVTSATTAALPAQKHQLEIEVTIGAAKTTYLSDVFDVRKGLLS